MENKSRELWKEIWEIGRVQSLQDHGGPDKDFWYYSRGYEKTVGKKGLRFSVNSKDDTNRRKGSDWRGYEKARISAKGVLPLVGYTG